MVDEQRLAARKDVLTTLLIHYGRTLSPEEIAKKAIIIADTLYEFDKGADLENKLKNG